ncbi:MAG TPA: hypothetical protein ENH39_03735, partial [Gammaproteobacteria bacterium]|nr:hypothetical protein [Gammaproteobacteria bacterium]
SLLLNEPDYGLQDTLQRAGYSVAGERQVRQLFFDRLGIPQSGLYLPPYEHVFRKRELIDGIWHFPPARYDGALAVEQVYRVLGFQRDEVSVSPLFSGANIPGDHLGLMLVFTGLALQGIAADDDGNMALRAAINSFIQEHLGEWVDVFCESLPLSDTNGYLGALADAVKEASDLLKKWCTDNMRVGLPTAYANAH